jgi:LytS/YehU family sensor histidine kinase
MLVERYLEIEQVRLGPRLQATIEADAATTECLVPPLLLQPVVENAIVHGVGRRLRGCRRGQEAEGSLIGSIASGFLAGPHGWQ